MEKALSDKDIKNALEDDVRVIVYSDLYNFDNILDAIGPTQKLVILYETSDNFGHWCCVFIEDDIIYFFDSYGCPIDDELEYISKKTRIRNGEDFRYLSYLLSQADNEIDYNDYQLQSLKPGVNTCGRWCVARLKNKHLDTEEFYELFMSDDSVSSDEIVLEYTKTLGL